MVPNVPSLDVELPGIDQVALVVEDMRDAVERYNAILGTDWTVYRFESPELTETTYRGEETEYGMLIGIGYVGDTMVELIEPTIGPNIYTEHLEEHGEDLHHVGYFSWDEEETYEVIEEFEDAGMGVIQSGEYLGTEFWYLDTADELNGLIFETAVRRDVGDREPVYEHPE